jgi:organic hydroperoxide reductase OsmC/OhrA
LKQHNYHTRMRWTGNDGEGTKTYRSYRRDHLISAEGKAEILGSSDPAFRGDATRYNPEELLLSALSACHMLAYLHLCAVNEVVVLSYEDSAHGVMEERPDGSGALVRVVLRPKVEVEADNQKERAQALHHRAHELCFIANSVNFAVEVEPEILSKPAPADGMELTAG